MADCTSLIGRPSRSMPFSIMRAIGVSVLRQRSTAAAILPSRMKSRMRFMKFMSSVEALRIARNRSTKMKIVTPPRNQQRPHQPASLGKQLPQTHSGLFGGRDFGGLQKCNHNVRKIIYLSSCLFSPRRKRPYRPATLCVPNRPHAGVRRAAANRRPAGVRAAAVACGGCGTCFSTAL